MAPEYAMQGYFSSKSDVYSFGVLVLEIISGERNNSYHHPELRINLITLVSARCKVKPFCCSSINSSLEHSVTAKLTVIQAWKLWNEGRVMEFIDPVMKESFNTTSLISSVNKCMNLALLCLQDRPNDRPSMASVVVMLQSDFVVSARPKQPTFTAKRSFSETDSSATEVKATSTNASITVLTGR